MAQNLKERTALVVIDMQRGIASAGRAFGPNDVKSVISNVSALVSVFRKAGAPVVLVHVDTKDGKDMLNPEVDQPMQWGGSRPADWADFIEEIVPESTDIIITKRQWGAFHGTELDLQLRRRNINTIVLCGISTNIGVETTAREAYQHGYNQVFAIDAMTAISREEHEATEKFIFPRIGRIRKTNEVLDLLK